MDNEAYLEHHGVKGQKWGVIRKGYQYSGSSGRSYSTFGSIKTSSKKSYMQKLGSGFIKNIKKEGLAAGIADTKLVGFDVGKSKSEVNYKRALNINKAKRLQTQAKRLKTGADPYTVSDEFKTNSEKAVANRITNALSGNKTREQNSLYSKSLSNMSNEELKAANDRLRMEQEYNERAKKINASNMTTGQKLMDTAKAVALASAKTAATSFLTAQIGNVLNEKFMSTAVPKGTEKDVNKAVKDALAELNKNNSSNSSNTSNQKSTNKQTVSSKPSNNKSSGPAPTAQKVTSTTSSNATKKTNDDYANGTKSLSDRSKEYDRINSLYQSSYGLNETYKQNKNIQSSLDSGNSFISRNSNSSKSNAYSAVDNWLNSKNNGGMSDSEVNIITDPRRLLPPANSD